MFNLKKPCKDCPFVKGSSTNTTLIEGRLDGIKYDLLNNHTFSCHKTVDYDKNNKNNEQHCVGAMLYLYKENRPNQMMRVGERLGFLDEDELLEGSKDTELDLD
ncbi:hypothetical protein Bp8pS_094 [Bacillus phage vB_BpuM-BpSp]|nr:hypothetical protein Bp8pS_094 [Bacillus phage vB_BpuM-BpSp]